MASSILPGPTTQKGYNNMVKIKRRIKRRCSKCGIVKLIGEFPRSKKKKYGYGHSCLECMREYHKLWYKKNREKITVQLRIERALNPFSRYGGTRRQYLLMLQRQDYGCAICNIKNKLLVVDHCHICGAHKYKAVRGLLCTSCNMHNTFSLDNPDILKRAYLYTMQHWNKYHSI